MFKIAFFGTKVYYHSYLEPAFTENGINARFFEMALTLETAFFANGNDGICVPYSCAIEKEMIQKLYAMGVKYLFVIGICKRNIDLEAAEGKLKIIYIEAYSAESVAEYSLGLCLAAGRQIHRGYIRTRDFNLNRNGLLGSNIAGKTVGIIGMGRVGQRLAQIYESFQANVISYDVSEHENSSVKSVSLEELLAESDIVSIHIPTMEQTYHMINRNSLAQMKKDAILVSTSGEGIIDYYDLIEALRNKKIGAAAIDYNRQEADIPEADGLEPEELEDITIQLSALNNALITFNLSYFTEESMKLIAEEFVNKIKELERPE